MSTTTEDIDYYETEEQKLQGWVDEIDNDNCLADDIFNDAVNEGLAGYLAGRLTDSGFERGLYFGMINVVAPRIRYASPDKRRNVADNIIREFTDRIIDLVRQVERDELLAEYGE